MAGARAPAGSPAARRVAVYELFDEVMDFGYPQFTEAKIMSDYIKTDAHKADVHEVTQSMAVTNAVSWRSEGLKYKVRARRGCGPPGAHR